MLSCTMNVQLEFSCGFAETYLKNSFYQLKLANFYS